MLPSPAGGRLGEGITGRPDRPAVGCARVGGKPGVEQPLVRLAAKLEKGFLFPS
jgi:hypothetical protein